MNEMCPVLMPSVCQGRGYMKNLPVQQTTRFSPDQMEAGIIDMLQHTVMQNMQKLASFLFILLDLPFPSVLNTTLHMLAGW